MRSPVFRQEEDRTLSDKTRPTPRVSVIMPCYNASAYLVAALDSVLAQEDIEVEIVAVDDGSTDDTMRILRGYADRIKILSQANSGPSVARNHGASHASGECLSFFDSDDVMQPGALSKLCKAICASGCGVAYGEAMFIDRDGKILTGKPMGYRSPGGQTLRSLCAGTLFQPGAGLFRRALFEEAGGFDTSFIGPEDLDLQYRCAARTEFAMIQDIVMLYRLNPHGLTRNYPRQLSMALRVHSVNAGRFRLWRRYPWQSLVGRLKVGYYFCGEHRSAQRNGSNVRLAEARRELTRHPWLYAMLATMPLLRMVKRVLVMIRLSRKAISASPPS